MKAWYYCALASFPGLSWLYIFNHFTGPSPPSTFAIIKTGAKEYLEMWWTVPAVQLWCGNVTNCTCRAIMMWKCDELYLLCNYVVEMWLTVPVVQLCWFWTQCSCSWLIRLARPPAHPQQATCCNASWPPYKKTQNAVTFSSRPLPQEGPTVHYITSNCKQTSCLVNFHGGNMPQVP